MTLESWTEPTVYESKLMERYNHEYDPNNIVHTITVIGCLKGRVISSWNCMWDLDVYAVWNSKTGHTYFNKVELSKITPLPKNKANKSIMIVIKDRKIVENTLMNFYKENFSHTVYEY